MSCNKCGGAGWVWWHELENYSGPASDPHDCYRDDTKYTCDACGGIRDGVFLDLDEFSRNDLKKDWLETAMKKAKKESILKKDLNLNVLNKLADQIYEHVKEKGFHEEAVPDVPRYVANLHCEISELFEAYRKSELNKLCDKADKMTELGLEPLTCAEEEIADIIIRVLDTAKCLKIDIAKSIINKMKYNRTRSFKHGGKLA